MSHLSLDARAILEYLNELGYRNITADQLKEFMKGMQPQSEINKSKHKAKSSSNPSQLHFQQSQQLPATTSASGRSKAAATTATTIDSSNPTKRSHIKVIKSKKPLCHFKFYVDVCDHQLTKRIEEQIKSLGGNLEFFLTPNVTHFVTDKTVLPPIVGSNNNNNYNNNNNSNNNNNKFSSRPGTPKTPLTPNTPQTPYSIDSYDAKSCGSITNTTTPSTSVSVTKQKRQTRADAILSRARRQNSTLNNNTESQQLQQQHHKTLPSKSDPQQKYIIWHTDAALRFFRKVENELKHYLASSQQRKQLGGGKSYGVLPTQLKGSFIKIESVQNNFRPYYHLCKKPIEWPKIELSQDEGAFRFTPKKSPAEILAEDKLKQKMTRKSRSRSSQRPHGLPNAVQKLKKGEACNTKTSTGGQQLHSNNGVACKQMKESSDKQCGVCEICKIEYDTLTIHLKTKDHEYFAKNSDNFIALDTLIHASADVNKFLNDNNKLELNAELSEMEVDDDTSGVLDEPDPIGNDDCVNEVIQRKRRTSGSLKTPSPTIREKSKRTTKGKHSSEKFQQSAMKTTPLTVKTTKLKSTSPQKKLSGNILELQNNDANIANAVTPTTPLNRKRTSTASVYSPPMRAMLPPNSLYKVVETQEMGTPPRKTTNNRDLGDQQSAVASPSLIVKFKKVRTTELHRLHGEAESFMFPKCRSSSDLPTDTDRQTTSDNMRVSMSSTSLDSESLMDIDSENTECTPMQQNLSKSQIANSTKKVLAKPRRRRGEVALLQNFPATPIQPEIQLKRSRKSKTETITAPLIEPSEVEVEETTTLPIVASTTSALSIITLPEATRKSSRTATAIVTAATTSSRLLRAAVEAARNSNRRCTPGSDGGITPPPTKSSLAALSSSTVPVPGSDGGASNNDGPKKAVKRRYCRKKDKDLVVNMEDRVGETQNDSNKIIAVASNLEATIKVEQESASEMDDVAIDDDPDYDDDDEDDANDADYISHSYYKNRRKNTRTRLFSDKDTSNAGTGKRGSRTRRKRSDSVKIKVEPMEDPVPVTASAKRSTAKIIKTLKPQKTLLPTTPCKPPAAPVFDYSQSDRIKKYRYAFERLPMVDIWYKVFKRQDECKERYFEYYGSTNYRKLPYELGPIPFDRTTSSGCCQLCNKMTRDSIATKETPSMADIKIKQEVDSCDYAMKSDTESHGVRKIMANQLNGATSSSRRDGKFSAQYAHKHKKLHLLQRYQMEQQELLRQQLDDQSRDEKLLGDPNNVDANIRSITSNTTTANAANINTAMPRCDSKGSSPERGREREREIERERERAGSSQSNASSYASSTATSTTKRKYRNKHLHRAALMSLELPPRKSPREHASTLALVSCIIKQRQDSQSIPNSETDEPPTTPIPVASSKEEMKPLVPAVMGLANQAVNIATQTNTASIIDAPSGIQSPRTTRSSAPTPVEEMRFATEISENVKRMRRGQNKYDHSPPVVYSPPRRAARGRPNRSPLGRRLPVQNRQPVYNIKKRQRQKKNNLPITAMKKYSFGSNKAMLASKNASVPLIRKTGSKKGVLEYEMDDAALKALDTAMKHINYRQLEWEIDKYIELAGKDYDFDIDINAEDFASDYAPETLQSSRQSSTVPTRDKSITSKLKSNAIQLDTNTPPTTDYFSSDFDLYDLITNPEGSNGIDDELSNGKRKNIGLYNSVALHSYFRKRKTLKSNRTGWPKIQKKKSVRQQQQKIRILQNVKLENIETENALLAADESEKKNFGIFNQIVANDAVQRPETRKNGVITPPDSDKDMLQDYKLTGGNDDGATLEKQADEEDGKEDDMDAAESIADSVEDEHDVDADEEAEDDDDDFTLNLENSQSNFPNLRQNSECHLDENQEDDDDDHNEKRSACRNSGTISPIGKMANSLLSNSINSAATSTPSTQTLRGLRRTPQLNGSLGSCISPSEKAGDNSDIFTVSSDGLDTDLDVSNSQYQHKGSGGGDDNHHHNRERCVNHTPKRKLDISKYVANRTSGPNCETDAATAAVKSLAISQFLKKEVRVTCRRLRGPFRRFRFRR